LGVEETPTRGWLKTTAIERLNSRPPEKKIDWLKTGESGFERLLRKKVSCIVSGSGGDDSNLKVEAQGIRKSQFPFLKKTPKG